jgi:endogenous inhibitor of DNA gyrase (YacG/DUF329 family)
MSAPPPDAGPPNGLHCPVCGKPRAAAFRPFCSKRCAEIDLGRWLKGGYAIPGRDEDEGEAAPPATGEDPEHGR